MSANAFRLIGSTPVESLNIEVQHYEHVATGAVHYHLVSEHDEKAFMVAVRTMPKDSTGVAHILEHSVLCGSEKYPVRDPFFMMTRRSLNTFMNAMTSSDWTAYPFASQNDKDFNNLLDVYLDAVFFSRLHPLDFAQEGHRIEPKDPNDPDSPACGLRPATAIRGLEIPKRDSKSREVVRPVSTTRLVVNISGTLRSGI